MTTRADQLRDARRAFAAPGSFHDRAIQVLAVGLPAMVGAILAMLMILPLFPKGEVSFLLDRNRVAVVEDRLTVNSATYRGEDDNGRMFTISAGHATQHTARIPIVKMEKLVAHMQLPDGTAQTVAPTGDYHLDTDQVIAQGPVRITTTTGYSMVASAVALDLKNHRAFGDGGVTGELVTGPFKADRVSADLATHTITLDGHAHLRINQGKMKTLR